MDSISTLSIVEFSMCKAPWGRYSLSSMAIQWRENSSLAVLIWKFHRGGALNWALKDG